MQLNSSKHSTQGLIWIILAIILPVFSFIFISHYLRLKRPQKKITPKNLDEKEPDKTSENEKIITIYDEELKNEFDNLCQKTQKTAEDKKRLAELRIELHEK